MESEKDVFAEGTAGYILDLSEGERLSGAGMGRKEGLGKPSSKRTGEPQKPEVAMNET